MIISPLCRFLCCCRKVFCTCCKFFIICKKHSSTPSCKSFVTIKTKNRNLSKSTCMFSFIKRTYRFSCIFNKHQVMLITDCTNFINTAWMTKCMHRNTSRNYTASVLINTFATFLRCIIFQEVF